MITSLYCTSKGCFICRNAPCRAVPCRAVPCRAVPCRAVPCRAVPCRAVPCRAVHREILFGIDKTTGTSRFYKIVLVVVPFKAEL